MAAALAFGLKAAVPDGVAAAWGARWIWPDDQLYDRQSACGTDEGKAALLDWLNGGACAAARQRARSMAGLDLAPVKRTRPGQPKPDRRRAEVRAAARTGPRWRSSDDDQRELYRDDRGVIVGCPNSSYGYLYVAAWLHPAA